MNQKELAAVALELAGEAAGQLKRWQALFEESLCDAEDDDRLLELKEFAAFLTCLKRTLEIARIATIDAPGGTDEQQPALDSETLRKILFEED